MHVVFCLYERQTNIYLLLVHMLQKVAPQAYGGAGSGSEILYKQMKLKSTTQEAVYILGSDWKIKQDMTTFMCSPSMLTLLGDRRVSKIGLMFFMYILLVN